MRFLRPVSYETMTSKILHSTSAYKNNGLKNTMMKLWYSTSVNSMKKEEPKHGSTIDQEDLDKFTKESKKWWDTEGPMQALHAMNMIRIPFVRDGLVQCAPNERSCTPLKNKKILDVGCGGGILSEALAKIGAEVTGIDANKYMIEVAQQHCAFNSQLLVKPDYQCTTVEEHINTRKDYYDGVVASEVIEHVNNQELFVKSCVDALKPGGRIFFTTLNRTPMSRLFCIYVAEYVLNLLPKGTHQYEKFITPNELTFLLERNNCQVEVVYGTMFNGLTKRWSFVSSQALMYALQAQKLETKKS